MVVLGIVGIPVFHTMPLRKCNIVNKPVESVDNLLKTALEMPVPSPLGANLVVKTFAG